MKGLSLILVFAAMIFSSWAAQAQVTSENIVKGKGVLTCNGGGGGKPLFNSECKQVSINRVTTSGGSIKYEITCTDSGNITFQMACDAYALEQKLVVF